MGKHSTSRTAFAAHLNTRLKAKVNVLHYVSGITLPLLCAGASVVQAGQQLAWHSLAVNGFCFSYDSGIWQFPGMSCLWNFNSMH